MWEQFLVREFMSPDHSSAVEEEQEDGDKFKRKPREIFWKEDLERDRLPELSEFFKKCDTAGATPHKIPRKLRPGRSPPWDSKSADVWLHRKQGRADDFVLRAEILQRAPRSYVLKYQADSTPRSSHPVTPATALSQEIVNMEIDTGTDDDLTAGEPTSALKRKRLPIATLTDLQAEEREVCAIEAELAVAQRRAALAARKAAASTQLEAIRVRSGIPNAAPVAPCQHHTGTTPAPHQHATAVDGEDDAQSDGSPGSAAPVSVKRTRHETTQSRSHSPAAASKRASAMLAAATTPKT